MKNNYLAMLRDGKPLSVRQMVTLTAQLSLPAILAQISSIVMQYIDASMVGHLGSGQSASIGLVSSSTWLIGGLCMAASVGFTVQIAHLIGAKEDREARKIVRLGLFVTFLFGCVLMGLAALISGFLPVWLGGEASICDDASKYFLVFALTIPVMQLNRVSAGMLQCSGNMKLPSLLHVIMCGLDVIFNALFIFPSRQILLLGTAVNLPGANLGVMGAALGTSMAESVTTVLMLFFLLVKSPMLGLRKEEKLEFSGDRLKAAARIAAPVAFEQIVMCGAYIMSTAIVSPLGTIAIAAHSFSVTCESLCYEPGYGIGSAATTLIGQSIGAGRKKETRKFAWLTTILGMAVMTGTGILMYFFAPYMIGLLSPDPAICELGTAVLQIEAFAEPLYAASIVATGVFRGAGDTLVPSVMNLASMWLVRLPLSAYLAKTMGLRGVWIAMCVELCFRGTIFLIRLAGRRWQRVRGLILEEKEEMES